MKESNALEYCLAALVFVEAAALYLALTTGLDCIAYVLPFGISIASITITWMAFRDFFRQFSGTTRTDTTQ